MLYCSGQERVNKKMIMQTPGSDNALALNICQNQRKQIWVIETPGFFRKRRLKILAERIDITR